VNKSDINISSFVDSRCRTGLWLTCAGLLVLFWACTKEKIPLPDSDIYELKVPAGFPIPLIPSDNELTKSRIELGRRLFYDPVLSKDSTRSCGSCHYAQLAFSDSTAVSFGIEQRPGTRNAPSLANVAYQTRLLREGGVPTLEMQVAVPIQEHNEFESNILAIADRLKGMPEYVAMSAKAYGREPDPFVITRSIAAFERTLLSGESPFDQWFFQGNSNALSESGKRGYALFNSDRLNCSKCHGGFLFTDQSYTNNGLYLVYPDSGRIRLTGLESDRGVFKVPSLRNIALTGPYMHHGSISTLEAVIEHYETGGKAHQNKSPLIKPFTLNSQERNDLLVFLNSLTDQSFINNPAFRN
jgi:cytochrome c peroxidase